MRRKKENSKSAKAERVSRMKSTIISRWRSRAVGTVTIARSISETLSRVGRRDQNLPMSSNLRFLKKLKQGKLSL